MHGKREVQFEWNQEIDEMKIEWQCSRAARAGIKEIHFRFAN